jgi:signal transduction histidine kinase/CheY-like chemotaxis protein
MSAKKSSIPLKIIISYLALFLLIAIVGWILYSENIVLSKTEVKINTEKTKILKIGNLLSNLYKTESIARQTIQSNNDVDLKNYTSQTAAINTEIDSLKILVNSPYQIVLLDSVKYLLSKKIKTIKELKAIRNKANDEVSVKNAINNLTKMQLSLSKLRIEDLVENPAAMGSYQRKVLEKYVAYLNQNIPDDSTNTLTNKASDSIILASKTLLNNVKNQTEKRKREASKEEYKLLQNEISISEQLRKMLNIIEREIILNSTKSDFEKESSLKKTNSIVTTAAIMALLLAIFFSILILSDFSKTQSYKNQLEVANTKTQSLLKNREQLIATVSHDLKTPLSTILGYTELLGQSELNKKQSYFAENIKLSSTYISKLVQDLLDLTQIEAGKLSIENIPFSVNRITDEVAKSVQSVYQQKPIDLILEMDEKLDQHCKSDPFRLRQVLSNIIENAYKFTESGTIKISTKIISKPQSISITIEDSGIGIEVDKQQLVFEEFTQADDAIEKKYGGSGLGLTISKKIIEILGGTLSLQSVLGKGSVFDIQIPLEFSNLYQKEEKKIVKKDIASIFVVDDDVNLLRLTSEILKKHNYRVFSFTDPNEALNAMQKTPFDILITDIQMPNMDGFEFIQKLKNTNYSNQPIIAITGRDNIAVETYLKTGFTHLVRKPYSPIDLIKIIGTFYDTEPAYLIDFPKTERQNKASTAYSLESIASFLPDDIMALKDVLSTFIVNTKSSLTDLEKAISSHSIARIKEIAHRICPMFKQIQADEITVLLEELEYNDYEIIENKVLFDSLKIKVDQLFLLLQEEVL